LNYALYFTVVVGHGTRLSARLRITLGPYAVCCRQW